MVGRVVRFVFTVLGLIGGLVWGYYGIVPLQGALLGFQLTPFQSTGLVVIVAALGALVGFLVAPLVVRLVLQFSAGLEAVLQRTPLQDIIIGALGLIVGLIIANLLGFAFSRIPWFGVILPTIGSLLFGYLGWVVAVRKREDLINLVHIIPGLRSQRESPESQSSTKILDTSVIIDGRIADIAESGFIEGPILIPSFVLEELQHIADSADSLRRNRGRRGLDILNKMQKELPIPVKIYDRPVGSPETEVDRKLVMLARKLQAKILTNDFNLNKVAELQGVPVLNINELANAVKPVVLPGEEMEVQLIRDGKEPGQGVGYLDDGTMVVVDGGKQFIGDRITVLVTSVLQTSAGRMIFAKPNTEGARALS